MSKRRRSDDDEGGPRSRRLSQRRRHHLYFVVDDWTSGYSIYKVDVADLDGDPGADLDSQANRFPDPPVFRLQCPHTCDAQFSVVGSKIIAMNYNKEVEEEGSPVLVYDTATRGLAVGPRIPIQVQESSKPVPAFDRLYVMGSTSFYKADDHLEVLAAGEKGGWAWNAVRMAPFNFRHIVCDAAHPDGHTVFFSVLERGTYSFDTETYEWKHHGDWLLPFKGHAYYDGEVDAWVGLHGDSSKPGTTVCSCDVIAVVSSAGDGEGRLLAPPPWKLAKEKMVCEDRERTNVVVLTHIGRGKFCLVEHRSRKGAHEYILDPCYLFYATKFKLRYDKDGGLRATARRTRSYAMPRVTNTHSWWVFGI